MTASLPWQDREVMTDHLISRCSGFRFLDRVFWHGGLPQKGMDPTWGANIGKRMYEATFQAWRHGECMAQVLCMLERIDGSSAT